jgi:hypothetical protein
MLTVCGQDGRVGFHSASADLKFIGRSIFSYETVFVYDAARV